MLVTTVRGKFMRKAFILSFEHIGVEHSDCVEQKCVTLGGGGQGGRELY